ncbi:MAG: hypothetical protein MUF18_06465 [Fimbriiglobus sp.]|nr:hypothetical protein [Fimbriiglobus sp.]
MRAGAAGAVGVVLAAAGCGWFSQSPLLPRNQMPPPPPVTFSTYTKDGWNWDAVARVVVLTPRNESAYTRAGAEFQAALTSELQRLGRFEVIASPIDDHANLSTIAHRSGAFDERTMLDIARTTRADVVVLPTVTQYSPYPRPRMGVVLQAVAPAEGKVIGSVDGLWDTTDGGVAEQVRAYYRQRPKPLPAYVRNFSITADDNFAEDLSLDSPALFQRWVAHKTARLLVEGDGVVVGGACESPNTRPCPDR